MTGELIELDNSQEAALEKKPPRKVLWPLGI